MNENRRRTLLDRLDDERRNMKYAGQVTEILAHVTRMSAIDGRWHNVTSPSLTADVAEATIVAEIEHHRRIGKSFEWKVYAHDPLTDLRDRLARHGFFIGPLEAVAVLDLADPPGWVNDTSITVRRVETLEQVETYGRVSAAVFGEKFRFESELADGLRTGSTQIRGYIAYAGNDPVSIGRLYTHPQSWFGGLYGGGTIAAHRGRGFYRALIAARARDAIASGTQYLLVDALPTSRPILQRLGFERVADTWACEWTPT